MYTPHSLVDGVLLCALLSLQSVEGFLDIVYERLVIEVAVVLAVQVFQGFQFLYISHSHVGSQIEVEGRNSLTAVHLVLGTLHGDTSQHRGRLNALGRTTGTVSGNETAGQDVVQRMLHTG